MRDDWEESIWLWVVISVVVFGWVFLSMIIKYP